MIVLADLDGNNLCVLCHSISPITYEPNQIKNKLIDGSIHIQTIGEATKKVNVSVICNTDQVSKINLMNSIASNFKIVDEVNEYICRIDNNPNWGKAISHFKDRNKRLYEANLDFVIEEII